jgi:hypothetical protein
MVRTFERKVLRRIYGPIEEKGCWHSRWNSKLYSLYRDLNIMDDVKTRRLGCVGHIIRMEDEIIKKKREILNGKFCNTQDQ